MIKPVSPASSFTIRDLAAEFGVTARALRFYEQKGLLTPDRKGAQRIYSAADRARLALILRGRQPPFRRGPALRLRKRSWRRQAADAPQPAHG